MPADALLPFLLTAVAAYLLGSIDFSIIVTRLFARTDVRRHGSGNAGATNVLRTAGILPAVLTFAGDFLKCVGAVLIGRFLFRLFGPAAVPAVYITGTAGVACILGHMFPVFFGFHGGKGVTAMAAFALMIDWRCFAIAISLFIVLLLATRIVSLSALSAILAFVALVYVFFRIGGNGAIPATAFAGLSAALIFLRHQGNIRRLAAGTEPRISLRRGGRA